MTEPLPFLRWGVLALLASGCSATLPPAPPHANSRVAATGAPSGLCWLEYSVDEKPGGFGVAGGSGNDTWEITYSGLLIRHPQGDLLLDAGNSTHFAEERRTAHLLPRLLLTLYPGAGTVVASAPDALRRAGEDPARLSAVALSHVHADHAGGVMDLPGIPVVLASSELELVHQRKDLGGFDVVLAEGREIERRAKPIVFAATAYQNFDESFDYYGDGSVVFVPLPGHTPGSVGTFVNRSPTERYFHVGDAVNTMEAVWRRRGKSFAMTITDRDHDAADDTVRKLAQLHAQDPSLIILPAHDRRAWARAFGAPGSCR